MGNLVMSSFFYFSASHFPRDRLQLPRISLALLPLFHVPLQVLQLLSACATVALLTSAFRNGINAGLAEELQSVDIASLVGESCNNTSANITSQTFKEPWHHMEEEELVVAFSIAPSSLRGMYASTSLMYGITHNVGVMPLSSNPQA